MATDDPARRHRAQALRAEVEETLRAADEMPYFAMGGDREVERKRLGAMMAAQQTLLRRHREWLTELCAALAAAETRVDAARAEGYDIGFDASGEGWNAEWPFGSQSRTAEQMAEYRRQYEAQKAAALRARGEEDKQ